MSRDHDQDGRLNDDGSRDNTQSEPSQPERAEASLRPHRKAGPSGIRRHRWLVFLLMMVGSCGAAKGDSERRDVPFPAPAESRGGGAETSMVFAEALWQDPHRRPLAVANMALSFLLIVAAILLALRHKMALWWIRQSLIANGIWAALSACSQGFHLWHSPAVFERIVRMGPWFPSEANAAGANLGELGQQALMISCLLLVVQLAARCFLYVLLYRAARPIPVRSKR